MANKPNKISGSAKLKKAVPLPAKTGTSGSSMAKARTSPGVTTGTSGASQVNPLYRAARGVARYVGNAAREVRDIPTAIGTSILEKDPLEFRVQMNEALAAITAGEPGQTVVTKDAFGNYKSGYESRKKKKPARKS